MAVRTAALELFVQGLGQDALDGLEGQHTAHDAELVLKGNILGADVFAAEEAHAAEYALIVADHIIVLVLGTVVAGIDVETGEAVDGRRAEEVLAHPGRAAGRDAAAAFDERSSSKICSASSFSMRFSSARGSNALSCV